MALCGRDPYSSIRSVEVIGIILDIFRSHTHTNNIYVTFPATKGTCGTNSAIYDPTALYGTEVPSCELY
jgi:hypothetical protein